MASRVAIIDTVRQGTAQVERTFGSLTDEQLRTKVHDDERGWTAKDVLAHLAARGSTNDRLVKLGVGESTPLSADAGMDDWNQALVDERTGRSKEALLAEFRAVQDALIAQVQTLPDDALARPIPLPPATMLLGDLLGMAGGAHASHHAQAVEQAIARSAGPVSGS
jgi:hypothetical protein